MLECDEFLGCFGNCEDTIATGIVPTELGIFTFEFWFNNVLHKNTITVENFTEIKLPNVFTPSMLHCVKVIDPNGVKIKNISFKVHTQCL